MTVFDTSICEPMSVYGRFKQAVYGIRFRRDGKLMGMFCSIKIVKVVSLEQPLRRANVPTSDGG
ncbi:unnamed protein product [Gongylonema pulchrum]|uniref:Uncharacterized protein n=1 Tax=Gongylonema pulchrum TaxID=637853 RepID=A0A3P6RFD8_9BILA|nr:unnamed protein product [Gongylonema pulchrum]